MAYAPTWRCNSVADELMLDGNARQNLATFCQTWFDDGIHKLMDLSLDKNMIDKDEYPATAEIESRCVHLWRIFGTRRQPERQSDVRRPARAKPQCSAASPSSGSGANGARSW